MEKSNAKVGFFIGLLNFLHIIMVFMNRQLIVLPEDDRTIIISAWFIITVILAITGFFLSKKGYSEERQNASLGIAGMALNGLVILPAILLLLGAIFSGTSGKRR
jgi:hypothetical protein